MSAALRWGFLGAARIADRYAVAIPGSNAGRVLSVASRDPARAQAFAAKHGIPRTHESYDALLADPEIDVVYIGLPNSHHAPWSIRALEAGKHVLCEKPLAADAVEARGMQAAAWRTGRVLMEALMYKLHPVNRRTIELLCGGAIGDLLSGHASFYADVPASDPIRLSRELAGGALRDLGSYAVSFLRWAAGKEPLAVAAQAQLVCEGGVDLQSQGLLTFPGGVLGSIGCGFASPFVCSYELIGTKGRLVADNGPLCAWPGGEFSVRHMDLDGKTTDHAVPPADSYSLMAEEFARAVASGGTGDIQDAVANLNVLDSLRASAGIA